MVCSGGADQAAEGQETSDRVPAVRHRLHEEERQEIPYRPAGNIGRCVRCTLNLEIFRSVHISGVTTNSRPPAKAAKHGRWPPYHQSNFTKGEV